MTPHAKKILIWSGVGLGGALLAYYLYNRYTAANSASASPTSIDQGGLGGITLGLPTSGSTPGEIIAGVSDSGATVAPTGTTSTGVTAVPISSPAPAPAPSSPLAAHLFKLGGVFTPLLAPGGAGGNVYTETLANGINVGVTRASGHYQVF